MQTTIWMTSIIFFILGGAFLALGFRGLKTKRPFAYPAKFNLWLIGLAFLPQIVLPVKTFFDLSSSPHHAAGSFSLYLPLLVPLIMYPLLFVFLRKQMNGYLFLGITDDSFRTTLHRALEKNNILFQETISAMHLTEINADLQASVQSWMGVAQLRVKQPQHQSVLDKVAATMNEEFSTPGMQINMTTCVFYVVMGAIIFLMAGCFAFLPFVMTR